MRKVLLLTVFCSLLLQNLWSQQQSSVSEGDQFLKLAGQLIDKEKFDVAKTILSKAKSKGANPIIISYNLGYIEYKQKNFVQAIKHFRYCIKNAPAFRNVYQSLALLYNSLGLQLKGILVLKEYVEHNGEDALFYIFIGDLYRQIEFYVESDEYYQKSLEIDGTQDLPYISIANLYVALGDIPRALSVIELGISRVQTPKELLLKKADFLASLENFIEAAGICSLILDLYPPIDDQEKYNLTYAMASFYLDAGLDMVCIDILKDCIQKFPDKAGNALDLLEYTFLEAGLYQQAIEFYDDFFVKNRKKIYTLVRKLFQKVFYEKNEAVLQQIISFYDKYRLRDDLYALAKEILNISKRKK